MGIGSNLLDDLGSMLLNIEIDSDLWVGKNGKEKLEYACERMLELSSVPSIRTIAVILKNGKEPERKTTSPADSEKYGITRGAAYFKKGGDRNA